MIDLGGIYISIQGDTSKLEADIARAQSISKAAGADIAAAFTTSAANASKLADAIGEVIVATEALSAAQKQAGLSAQSAGKQAVDSTKQQEAELLALFDIEYATPKAAAIPAPELAAASTSAGVSPVNSSAIEDVTALGTAATETSVAVTALGTATTQAAIPISEFGFVSKAAAKFVAEMGAAAALGAAPIASVGAAAAASAAPLAAMGAAAASPALATAAASAATLGTAVNGAGTAAQTATPKIAGMTAAQQTAASWFASTAGNVAAATAATNTNVAAVTRLGQAYGRSVSEIQAASGAIRTFEGNQSLRAVESFTTRVLGLGPVFQTIFPIVGAIALGEALYRVFEKVDPLVQAEKELARVTAENDKEFAQLGQTIDKLNIERVTLELGKVAGIKVGSFYDESAAKADEANIKYTADLIERTKQKMAQETAPESSPFKRALNILGGPLTFGAEVQNFEQSRADAKDILKYQDEIATAQERLRVFQAKKPLEDEKAAKETAVEGAQTALAGIANQIAANKRLGDAKRQAVENSLALDKQAEDAQIAGAESSKVRALASATQELQIAKTRAAQLKAIDDKELADHIAMLQKKAAAESVGKDKQQRATIQTNIQGEITATQGENAKKQIALDAAVAASAAKVEQTRATIARESKVELDQLVRESEQLLERNTAQLEDATTRLEELKSQANVRITETQAKGGGERDQLQIQQQKLQLERQYGLEIGHTLNQEIAQEEALAAFDAKGRDAKVAGLQAELQIAHAAQKEAAEKSDTALFTGDTKEATRAGEEETRNLVKSKELEEEIKKLKIEGSNAELQAQIKIDQLRRLRDLRKSVGQDVFNAGQQVPGAIGAGLARGIIDGKGIGRDIKQELKGIGQELLGNLFRQIIQELIVKLGIEAAEIAILGAIFGTSAATQAGASAAVSSALSVAAAATITNTGAIHLNTAALLKSAAGGIAGGASGAAGSAGSAAGSAASGLLGPLIAAAGGIIGGFISGIMSLVGAHQIVRAVNATTAAVLSLKGHMGTDSGSSSSSSSNSASAGHESAWHRLGAMFESITGAGAMKVNIVAISPFAGMAGFLSLFFAEGGRPAVGKTAIVGEKGPELFVPDAAGTIIPAGQFTVVAPESKAVRGSPVRNGALGAIGMHNLSPNLKLSLPDLGLPNSDATLTRTPAPSQRTVTSSEGTTIHLHGAQFHGVQNVRELMREISQYAKTQSPRFSPYAK